jgi:hypothetical protein
MIIPALFTLALGFSCPDTRIENYTTTWNKQDQETFEHSKIRCGELYPEAPCLKMFRKKDDDTYNAVCGEKVKDK